MFFDRRKRFSKQLLSGAAVLALAALSSVAQAEVANYSIPPQPLDEALRAFGAQSGHPLMVDTKLVSTKKSPGVTAAVDPETALKHLLSGTGLSYKREGDVFAIVAAQAEPVRVAPKSAVAATETLSGSAVEGLVVTAQKRRENIQDVPIAISAFTQDKLEISQIAGGPDLMTQVPNLTFTKTNFTGYSIQIRGIGTQAISATTDAAVAIAFNNTSMIRNRFFEQEFFDLERLEVLRGPQGTLYGRNATAGAINLISAKPSFEGEAKVSVDVGNFESRRSEGMVNYPLVEDKVALRLAGAWTKREGYATNELSGNPIDDRDLWSTRLSLRIAPTDRIDANIIWEHFEEEDGRLRSGKQLCKKDLKAEIGGVAMPPITAGIGDPASTYSQGCAPVSLYSDDAFQTPNGYSLPYYLPLIQLGLPGIVGLDPYLSATQSRDLRVIESTIDPEYRAHSDLAQIQLSYDLTDHLTLSSETAYSSDVIWSMQDFNRFTTTPQAFGDIWVRAPRENLLSEEGVFCDPQLGCSDRLLAADLSTAESRQFSQEFRLTSDFDGPFNFSAGINYLRYDTEDKYYVFINTLTLTSASRNVGGPTPPPPWERGVSDNHECLNQIREGNPAEVQQIALTNCWYIDPNPIDNLNDMGHNYFLSRNPYKLISYAAFGETYFNITDNLKITAGLRWTVDRKTAPEIPSWLLAPKTVGYPVSNVVRQDWSKPTGRLAIDWKPDLAFTDETLLYASYAHGYKAGGANPPPATITAYVTEGADELLNDSLTHPKTFAPEYVDAIEIGSKNTLFDGGLVFNVNAFYYDYKGYQISEIVDRAAINHNFDAEVWGAELEVDWRPLENLRFGFKGGYENTRVADGMRAIDLMDRTAGNPDWVVARPFPTVPSNCILPVWVVTFGDRMNIPPNRGFPNAGPCITAYQQGFDPVTQTHYVPNPTVYESESILYPLETIWDGYPGFNPASAPNNGEGFAKELGGNELPNAPKFTATLSADYTLPLNEAWLMTLHTDLYWQSEAWTRIFNFEPYDRLEAYTNVNFAAILNNEDAGWRVMAYVKNVFDKDNITGAFLNSDDTGLTTNVFLNEPRLYGVRVSKDWSGLPWGLRAHAPGKPYALTIELGGSVLRQTAENATLTDDSLNEFTQTLLPDAIQHHGLDWGDAREVKLTYAPGAGDWRVSAGVRMGKTNVSSRNLFEEKTGDAVCGVTIQVFCDNFPQLIKYATNSSWTDTAQHEDFIIADFTIGKDVGIGRLGEAATSSVTAGLGYAELTSETDLKIKGIPDWRLVEGFLSFPENSHTFNDAALSAKRSFKGIGPKLSWDASARLLGGGEDNRTSFDWSLGGGVLFGKQKTTIEGDVLQNYYYGTYDAATVLQPLTSDHISVDRKRSKSIVVPTLNASVGLSYRVDRFNISTGYRWERYFDAIDGGDSERRTFDRTIEGPYFKVGVAFGE